MPQPQLNWQLPPSTPAMPASTTTAAASSLTSRPETVSPGRHSGSSTRHWPKKISRLWSGRQNRPKRKSLPSFASPMTAPCCSPRLPSGMIDEQQLVATQVVTTSQELLKAIKATLATNNSKSYLTVKTPDDSAYLKGARRGYIASQQPGAGQRRWDGHCPAASAERRPTGHTFEFFYLVVASPEELSQRSSSNGSTWPSPGLCSRNGLNTCWKPVRRLVWCRCCLAQARISPGAAHLKNESKWQQLISDGLKPPSPNPLNEYQYPIQALD
jgi:hypothetical protein